MRAVPARSIWAAVFVMSFCQASLWAGEEKDERTINNEVAPGTPLAGGSFRQNDESILFVVVNTRPKTSILLSKKISTVETRSSDVSWVNTSHTNILHSWQAMNVAGKRIFVEIHGGFEFPKGDKGGEGEPPTWDSNSMDVDLDVDTEMPKDNTPEEDKKEMDDPGLKLALDASGSGFLRQLPPKLKEKQSDFKPKVRIERSNDGVDVLKPDGTSIFPTGKNISNNLTGDVIAAELKLTIKAGSTNGEVILTAILEFVDPSTKYPQEFKDPVRVTVGDAPGVDIDVDWNRNGKIDNDDDDDNEAAPIEFLGDSGALMLVNIDSDIGKDGDKSRRDMDDNIISNKEDQKDMSPISLHLKRNLEPDEGLYIVIRNGSDPDDVLWVNVMDREDTNKDDHVIVGSNPKRAEERIDNLEVDGPKIFPGGKLKRYDDRFLLEGLRFSQDVFIDLEIRKDDGTVTERDTVRILNCPWLANNYTQPLINSKKLKVDFNLANSSSFRFKGGHGAKVGLVHGNGGFAEDSVEWGFQVRRQKPAKDSRDMIVALKLFIDKEKEDTYPRDKFLNAEIGVYGYFDSDETVFESSSGDQGGNLECLPPSKGHLFGRIVHGDNATGTLRKFLSRQKAQVAGGAVILNISGEKNLGLVHVDEIICIVPTKKSFFVAMPDWGLARKLIKRGGKKDHGIAKVQPDGASKNLDTYRDIDRFLGRDKKFGIPLDNKFSTRIKKLQLQMSAQGVKVVKLPGMFLDIQGDQKSFPRNIANSQPTVATRLIVSKPPQQIKKRSKKKGIIHEDSIFWTEWKAILKKNGVTGEPEDMRTAWQFGGEAHCSGNAIRKPFRK